MAVLDVSTNGHGLGNKLSSNSLHSYVPPLQFSTIYENVIQQAAKFTNQ